MRSDVCLRSKAALSPLLPAERMEGPHVGVAESRQRLRGGCRPAVYARAVAHGHAAASRGAAGACVAQRWSIARAQANAVLMWKRIGVTDASKYGNGK